MDRWVADALDVIPILKIARNNFQKNSKQMERVTVENNGIALHKNYCKDTEPFYDSIIYSLVSLLSGIYPLHQFKRYVVKDSFTEG